MTCMYHLYVSISVRICEALCLLIIHYLYALWHAFGSNNGLKKGRCVTRDVGHDDSTNGIALLMLQSVVYMH